MVDKNIWLLDLERYLSNFSNDNKSYFISSSFQSHSIPLLHGLSKIDKNISVYFLDTGFHFPETYQFVRTISNLLDIETKMLSSAIPKSRQLDRNGNFLFCSNPNRCCDINKVAPMDPILAKYDVWISGVRRDQNKNRSTFETVMPGPSGTVRYHPMLDWTSKDIYYYRIEHNLPSHPLEEHGYLSIGCSPCTNKATDRDGGRWSGSQKDECGLNILPTNQISK